ncbi:P-loop containing nucleoside triphosphate hydrolase protein [Syncephalis plumigaleata]|nr:P-loop containing nucleoside triphosphate hydrolase protein [Syncephalis plumigaleata]
MVPKKRQSKRVSCSQKYKIEKRVREAHRKQRKEAKKNGGSGKKIKKDPGIPNLWPYKEKLLNQIEGAKREVEKEKTRAKKLREQKKQQANSLQALAKSAAQRAKAFVGEDNTDALAGVREMQESAVTTKDNSRRAYYREFRKVVEAADVILEVLDARDPLGCRAKHVEQYIMDSGTRKRIILILNKIDLVPRETVEQWLKYLRNEFPTIAFKASTQSQRQHLGQSNVAVHLANDNALNRSEKNLVKLLKNYSRNANLKTSITVGVIGFPNVGKSSVINSLRRARVCTVGATPDHLDKNIKLIDCPGIVFSRNPAKDSIETLLRNCVKLELLDDPISPVETVISRCDRQQLMMLYGLPVFNSTQEFLVLLAQQRGKLKKGGVADLEGAARSVLQDWNNGKIPFYTVPPATQHIQRSELVATWGKEFDFGAVNELDQSALSATKSGGNKGIAMVATESTEANDAIDWINASDDDMEEEEDEEQKWTRMMPWRYGQDYSRRDEHTGPVGYEASINPQSNLALKKQSKKQRKQAARSAALLASLPGDEDADTMAMDEEAYDFGEYYSKHL